MTLSRFSVSVSPQTLRTSPGHLHLNFLPEVLIIRITYFVLNHIMLVVYCLAVYFYFILFFKAYLFFRERVQEAEGQRERGRQDPR